MIIKNGLVVDPALGLSEKMDLAIENGTILKIEKNIDTDQVSNDTKVLDATGLVVAPGLIDTHVHFRDPGFTYKEDLHTGALAAAKGGFTSVICMANTSPVVDSLPVLKDLIDREKNEDIRIFQAAAISCSLKGKEAVDMEAMKNAGACGFTDDGIPLLDADFCYRAMEVSMRKILLLFRIMESITVLYLKSLASMVPLPLPRNRWLPVTVFWHFAPAQMLLSSISALVSL